MVECDAVHQQHLKNEDVEKIPRTRSGGINYQGVKEACVIDVNALLSCDGTATCIHGMELCSHMYIALAQAAAECGYMECRLSIGPGFPFEHLKNRSNDLNGTYALN